eukprot:6190699-Pleurochrysis_carterae.AAC.3
MRGDRKIHKKSHERFVTDHKAYAGGNRRHGSARRSAQIRGSAHAASHLKNVSQVPVALGAHDLHAAHAKAVVHLQVHGSPHYARVNT